MSEYFVRCEWGAAPGDWQIRVIEVEADEIIRETVRNSHEIFEKLGLKKATSALVFAVSWADRFFSWDSLFRGEEAMTLKKLIDTEFLVDEKII